MKNILLFASLIAIFCSSCSESNPKLATDTSNISTKDQKQLEETIHGFYVWYNAFQKDTAKSNFYFIDQSAEHAKLDPTKLETYLLQFKASNYICDEFLAGEKSFWQKCSQAWPLTTIPENPAGVEIDKYVCGQDHPEKEYETGPISVRMMTGERADVILTVGKDADIKSLPIKLKKENNRWLITSIECDLE
jgi:hypothetical protein